MNNIGFRDWKEFESANKEQIIVKLYQISDYQILKYKSGINGWERNSVKFRTPKQLNQELGNNLALGFDRTSMITYYGTYAEYPSPKSKMTSFKELDIETLKILYEEGYSSVFYLPDNKFQKGVTHWITKKTFEESFGFFAPLTFKEAYVIEGTPVEEEEFIYKAFYQNNLYAQVSIFLKLKGTVKSECIYNRVYKI